MVALAAREMLAALGTQHHDRLGRHDDEAIASEPMGVLDGWRLCPRCGHALEQRDGNHRHCPACGSSYWANSAPAVQGLLVRDGRVLIGRRKLEPQKGMWDLPGGFLEEGEQPEAGLRREFLEETGIEVEPVEWLGVNIDPYGRRSSSRSAGWCGARASRSPTTTSRSSPGSDRTRYPTEMAFPSQTPYSDAGVEGLVSGRAGAATSRAICRSSRAAITNVRTGAPRTRRCRRRGRARRSPPGRARRRGTRARRRRGRGSAPRARRRRR